MFHPITYRLLTSSMAMFLIFSADSLASTYYVATQGSDNNPGSIFQPFKTIQKAANLVAAGDTVMVRQGFYRAVILRNINGTATNPIVFMSYPGETATIDRNLGGGNGNLSIEIQDGSYFIIDGFKITDSDPAIDVLIAAYDTDPSHPLIKELKTKNGIKSQGGAPHHAIIRNNEIYHVGSMGILWTKGNDNQFINNHIHDLAGYGVYLSGERMLVKGNRMHDCGGHGIRLANSSQNLLDSIIEENLSYDNGSPYFYHISSDRIIEVGDGIVLWHGRNNTIRNNVCHRNFKWGIRINGSNNYVFNNTVYDNGFQGFYFYDNNRSVVRNNISYFNRGQGGYPGDYRIGTGNTHDHNSWNLNVSDPRFVDPVRGDFRLSPNSPAIDAGVAIADLDKDFDGVARPQGSGWDIGAYEFGGAPPPPPTSDFDFALRNSGNISAASNSSISNTITAELTSGLAESVSWAVSGLPDGVRASFPNSSCIPDCSTELTFDLAQSVPLGSFSITVTASARNGELSRSTSFDLRIMDPSGDLLNALRTTRRPVIDGILSEDAWPQAESVSFSNPSRSDNHVEAFSLWDSSAIYFAFKVSDSQIEAQNENYWEDDGLEIYLDVENDKTSSMDSDDFYCIINVNDLTRSTGVEVKTTRDDGGYLMELSVPWTLINTTASAGKTMGLLFGNNDRENGKSVQFDWLNLIESGNYARPNLWGNITLLDKQTGTTDTVPPATPNGLRAL